MAKESKTDVALDVSEVAPVEVAPAEFELTLDEVCQRISAGDKRVEMIGAFHSSEKAAGRLKDLESAYRSRFAAFCNAPA